MKLNQTNLVYDLDVTKGHVLDYEENGGALTGGHGIVKSKKGYAYLPQATANRITVPDSTSLQLTAGTFSIYAELVNEFDAISVFLDKRDAGGTNYTLYIANATTIGFLVSAGVVNFPISSNQFIGVDVITVTKSAGLSKAKLYFDGVFISESVSSFTLVANDADLIIGNDYVGTGPTTNPIYSIAIHSDEKTPAEVVDIWKALRTRKTTFKNKRNFHTSPSIPALTVGSGWNMDIPSGILVDQGVDGNDGTPLEVVQSETVWGETALSFNGDSSEIDCGNDSSLNFTTETFGGWCWVKSDNLSSDNFIMSRGLINTDGIEFFIDSTGVLSFSTNQSGASQSVVSDFSISTGGYHLCAFLSVAGDNNYVYIDGEDDSSSTVSRIDPTTSTKNLYFGRNNAGVSHLHGDMSAGILKTFTNKEGFETQLKAEWNRVAKKVVYYEDFSDAYIQQSAISGSGNTIPSTEWTVGSVSGQVVDGPNLGEKSITGAAVGAILETPMIDHAFGRFVINYESVAGSRCRHNIIDGAVFSIADFGGTNATISMIPSAGGGMTTTVGSLTNGDHEAIIDKKANKATLNTTFYNDGALQTADTGSNPYTDQTDIAGVRQLAPYGSAKIHSVVQYFGVMLE